MSVVKIGATLSKDTFRLLTVAEMEKMPPPEWLIEPLLMVDSQAILFGAPGEGKSFLALSLALAVATGRDWLGHKVKQGPVVYVAAEGGRGIWKRVRAWQHENRVATVDSMFFLLEAPQLRNATDLSKLLDTTAPHNPVLIVLDTLACTMVGADENTAKDVGEWVNAARKLQQETNATILTLHHTVKRTGKNKAPAERGSSALRGAADTMMAVIKKGSTLTLSCEKQKEEKEFENIALTMKEVTFESRETGPQNSLVIVRTDGRGEPVRTALSDGAETALGMLTELSAPRVSKGEWKAAVDRELGKEVRDRTFMNWVRELVDASEVERVSRGFYKVRSRSATASEVPSAAIGKAA